MRIKLSLTAMLLLVSLSGCNNAPNYTLFKLPSGKEIKITSTGKMNFASGGAALVMSYLTDVAIDDKVPLRQEVDEIWSVFQHDVEKADLKSGVIRATHLEGGGFIKNGKGYGFVFVKREDGKWHCLDDDRN